MLVYTFVVAIYISIGIIHCMLECFQAARGRDMEAKQLRSISKDEEFDSGGVKTAGRSPVKMPLCSAGDHDIKVSPSSDSWVLDGHYFFAFISGKGLVKL